MASSWWRVRSKNRYGFGQLPVQEAEVQVVVARRQPGADWAPSPSSAGTAAARRQRAFSSARKNARCLMVSVCSSRSPTEASMASRSASRAQFAGELHQRAAVLVAVAVEVLVQPFLDPVADGLEQERRDQHHRHQAGVADIFEILLHQVAQRENDAVESREHAHRRQACRRSPGGRGYPRPSAGSARSRSQGQRDQRQGQHRHLLVGVRHRAHGVGQHVQHGERQDAAEGAVAQPLELLPHDRIFGPAVLAAQRERRRRYTAPSRTPSTRGPASSAVPPGARAPSARPRRTPR